MFKKVKDYYNSKIDYKMIYFLNPKLDISRNYYETKKIYFNNENFISEQGKWFKKLKNIYDYLLSNDLDINKILLFSSKELEINVNDNIRFNDIKKFENVEISNNIYLATWYLREIILNKPLTKYSEELAILVFDSILKKEGFIPIIFLQDYRNYIAKLIEQKISIASLKDILSIYEDLSIKYDKKYTLLTKGQLIKIIKNKKALLTKKYDVKKVWLYGSFVRNEANEFSDVDLYIEFFNDVTGIKLINVQKYFKELLNRNVDILVENIKYKKYSTNALLEREVIFDDCK